ncbi:MAG: M15 family metallopeptidase [bacterium]|nr:M15 family metallopeptidase [bacterium]
MPKKLLLLLGIVLLFIAAYFGWLKFHDIFTEKITPVAELPMQNPLNQTDTTLQESKTFDKTEFSFSDSGSPWWVVNKTRPLPQGYVPPDLIVPNVRLRLGASNEQMQISSQIESDLKAMFAAATNEHVSLVFGSGYRSEALQRQFYNSYVAQDGQAEADRLSARPGTSEHQTGLSFDATSPSGKCHLETCFEDLPEGKWLRENAHKYGFIIRYVKGEESVTGYDYEPWHIRWVGKTLSSEMRRTNVQTLEEFFGLPAAPDYL